MAVARETCRRIHGRCRGRQRNPGQRRVDSHLQRRQDCEPTRLLGRELSVATTGSYQVANVRIRENLRSVVGRFSKPWRRVPVRSRAILGRAHLLDFTRTQTPSSGKWSELRIQIWNQIIATDRGHLCATGSNWRRVYIPRDYAKAISDTAIRVFATCENSAPAGNRNRPVSQTCLVPGPPRISWV